MNYYQKELVNTRVFRKSGRTIKFETVGGNMGLLETDDAELIGELETLIKERRGGVSEITAEQAEELKKNPPVIRSRPRLFDAVRAQSRPRAEAPQSANGAAAVPDGAQRNKGRKVPPIQSERMSVPTAEEVVPRQVALMKRREINEAAAKAEAANETEAAVVAQ